MVIVGIAFATDRAQGGSMPERLVVPGKCRGDPDARHCKQGGQKGSVDNPIVVSGLRQELGHDTPPSWG